MKKESPTVCSVAFKEEKISEKRVKCADCVECRMCSKNLCRLCRKGAHGSGLSELPTGFTHGQYLEWKKKKARVP